MFQNKIVNIVFSLLVALGLWVYVVGEINPETTQRYAGVEVRFINAGLLADRGLALVDPGTVTADLTLTGQRSDMKALDSSEIQVTADLADLEAGENTIRLEVSLPDGIKADQLSPSKVTIQVDSLESRDITVELVVQGAVPEGTEPGRISLDPETVTVTGAASSLERVASVQALISADQVTTKETRLTAALAAVDSEGRAVGYLDLSQAEASVSVTLLSLKTVPLTVPQTGTLPDGIHLVSLNVPETITLRGTASALKTISAVTTAPLDLSGLNASGNVPLEALLPEGIELAKASEGLSAALELSGETILTFTYTKADLAVAGLGDGLTLRLPDGNITLTVTATTHGAGSLSKGDFTLTLDLTGRDAGTFDIALSADTSADVLDLVIKPATLAVTLTNE
jgi:YbbR domain-containing protein